MRPDKIRQDNEKHDTLILTKHVNCLNLLLCLVASSNVYWRHSALYWASCLSVLWPSVIILSRNISGPSSGYWLILPLVIIPPLCPHWRLSKLSLLELKKSYMSPKRRKMDTAWRTTSLGMQQKLLVSLSSPKTMNNKRNFFGNGRAKKEETPGHRISMEGI